MRRSTPAVPALLPAALVAAAACASGVHSSDGIPYMTDGGVATVDGGSTATTGFGAPCARPSVGAPLLRLLTRSELDQTLLDIFPQVAGQWTDSLPSDNVSARGFDNDSAATVGNQTASGLLDTALSVATAVTGTALATILPCAATTADRTCAEGFLAKYGRRLFRRAITPAEHDRYLAFFDASMAKSNFKSALKWMTVGLIQSPLAVYRREIGDDKGQGARTLTPNEVATELAYTYTGSTPSESLLGAAESGNLGDPVALARGFLATTLGKEALQHFFEAYLGYTRVTSVQKAHVASFSDMTADMVAETHAFIDTVVFQKGGGLSDLLTSPTTNPSVKLAGYYGFPAPSKDFLSVGRPSGKGLGILAQGAFLATHANADASSPTQRGLFAYSRLLCHAKPTPPPDVPPISPPQPGTFTTRQRYEKQHDGPCASCHKLFDPIGFGFEHYDEGGRYRTDESGLPIDSAADVPNLDATPLFTFEDEEGLVTGLAKEGVVTQCFAAYLATYAFGTDEQCLGATKVSDLQSGRIGIAEAFADLAAEPHFTQRSSP